jgi:hypothetical protein
MDREPNKKYVNRLQVYSQKIKLSVDHNKKYKAKSDATTRRKMRCVHLQG